MERLGLTVGDLSIGVYGARFKGGFWLEGAHGFRLRGTQTNVFLHMRAI